MVFAANLGYPRFGSNRELKKALEAYWAGKISEADLLDAGKQLRLKHWQIQHDAGIDIIPSNDFSFYDHMLDMTCMIGAIPERYFPLGEAGELKQYFAMARGLQQNELDIPAMEMTKWFDTNYHYIVPEIKKNQQFRMASSKVVDEFREAKNMGIFTRPVLAGPVSYLLLSKSTFLDFVPIQALPDLLPVYRQILQNLADEGADWVQIDEPCLVQDLDATTQAAYRTAYHELSKVTGIRLMLTTYFGGLGENQSLAVDLPTAGLHIDLVRAPEQMKKFLAQLPEDKTISLGVVDGRNVWRTDLDAAFAQVKQAVSILHSERVQIAPSCSLLFSPHDLQLETKLDAELVSWLAFARQKIDELVLLKQAVNQGIETVTQSFAISRAAIASRRNSQRTHNPQVRERASAVAETMLRRQNEYPVRKAVQAESLALPVLPTTTIGSFPQTREVRAQRAARNKGVLSQDAYEAFLQEEIARTIQQQEKIGLDVFVHGEFERSDMVEYFGEQLTGFAFTEHGWVQSYGSRGVRPPIIYGDVSRPAPMTVRWSAFAQSQTKKPIKGMLTGPVTILEWSFIRDDQPREETCRQIAFAIRDEVIDLERAGIRIIQIDEPAFREGLPLRRADQEAYLQWAIDCFKLASSGVQDETQIHTHMCYAEFNEIIESIGRMDADVISIEASRSKMELLDTFQQYQYPGDIGPGIYDIHSPNVPSQEEIVQFIEKAARVVPLGRLWVNPDCGLKTRQWQEVIPALEHMVGAVRAFRELENKAGVPSSI